MTTITSIKLKVCGMRDPVNVLEIGTLQPAYMGFIFFRGSRRFVGDDFQVPAGLSRQIERVGVFVNESTDEMVRLAQRHDLALLQLHGHETPEQCDTLKKSGQRVIKVFSIDDDFDFGRLDPYKPFVDFFLFDTKGTYLGGNGVAFNWNILKQYDQEIPFFLSGGISPANIHEALGLNSLNLHALDVNSGAEKAVGVKDIGIVKELSRVITIGLDNK